MGFIGNYACSKLVWQRPEDSVIEPRESLGLGVAYSTKKPGHLLNIAASNMREYWPDRPHDFIGYLIDTNAGLAHLPLEYFDTYYAPRMIFGRYIKSLIERPEHSSVIHHKAHATRIHRSGPGLVVSLSNQDIISADYIVIATGLAPSGAMDRIFGWAQWGYLSNAWDSESLEF